MDSQINGFTGFGRHNPGFVSAKDAIRKAEIAAQAAKNDPVQQARQTLAQAQAFTSGLGSGADDANAHRGSAHRSAALKVAAPVSSRDSGLTFDPEKLARIPEADRRWAWVEVDLSAIRHNTQAVRNRLAHGVRLMAVVKADAYGHGALRVAQELEALGIVKGSVVQCKSFGKDFMAGMKTLVGGEITGYTEMLNEARQIAVKRMVDEAEGLGADAVVNIRYGSSAVMQGAAEVIAYGTAVRFK